MCIVNTSYGRLKGSQEKDYIAFLGIPYAKPPVGELRWKEPQPCEPWEGVRDALTYGHPAMQSPSQSIPGENRGLTDQSEDCLYLNIWTPDVDPVSKYPVYFNIHGGAYCCGSGNMDPKSPAVFTRRGIILVTLNYRLNMMGYFAHPELSAESPHYVSGNYAHFDQLAALKWVHENIGAFGGDPANICVGGCSAGSGSTEVLCASPLARGLFARAIMESGVGTDFLSQPEEGGSDTLEVTEAKGVEVMKLLGAKSVEEMRAMSYEEVTDLPELSFRRPYHYGTTLGFLKDGYLLPERAIVATEKQMMADIPYLVGNTHDEGAGFALFFQVEKYKESLKDMFKEDYEKLPLPSTKEEGLKMMHDMHTGFASAKAFAELQSMHGKPPVYVFDFRHPAPGFDGAFHGLEGQYIFGRVQNLKGAEDVDFQIAEDIQNYWCNFIRTGDPNGEGLPEWRPHTAQDHAVLEFNDTPSCTTEEHPLNRFAADYCVRESLKLKK